MRILRELVRLLATYNERVKGVEHDLSLQIETRANLGGSDVAEVAAAADADADEDEGEAQFAPEFMEVFKSFS